MMLWKAIFFALILLSSVSVIPLTVAQVAPVAIFQSPKKQTEQGAFIDQVKCNDNLVLMEKLSDNTPACVKPDTAKKLVERGWGVYVSPSANGNVSLPNSMHVDGSNFSVDYAITNAKVLGGQPYFPSKSLIISIKTTGNGQLVIDIPRALIDAKINNQTDDEFFVLNDGQESKFTETKTSTDRTLTIPFTSGTGQIEVIGSSVI